MSNKLPAKKSFPSLSKILFSLPSLYKTQLFGFRSFSFPLARSGPFSIWIYGLGVGGKTILLVSSLFLRAFIAFVFLFSAFMLSDFLQSFSLFLSGFSLFEIDFNPLESFGHHINHQPLFCYGSLRALSKWVFPTIAQGDATRFCVPFGTCILAPFTHLRSLRSPIWFFQLFWQNTLLMMMAPLFLDGLKVGFIEICSDFPQSAAGVNTYCFLLRAGAVVMFFLSVWLLLVAWLFTYVTAFFLGLDLCVSSFVSSFVVCLEVIKAFRPSLM